MWSVINNLFNILILNSRSNDITEIHCNVESGAQHHKPTYTNLNTLITRISCYFFFADPSSFRI